MNGDDFFFGFLTLMALLVIADFIVTMQESDAIARFEATPLAIPCPYCHAKRGEPCRGLRTECHVGREKHLRSKQRNFH